MSLGCLEVSNRVSNWNKWQNLIFVGSISQIFQLEIPIFIYKFNLWIHYESEFHMGSVYLFGKGAEKSHSTNFSTVIISNMSSGNTGFTFKLTFLSSIWVAVSYTGFVNLFCSFPKFHANLSFLWGQHHSRKRKLHTWFLCFGWCSFFDFWGADNHVFHILAIRSRSYELKSFVCLEVSNRVSNWNKSKTLLYASSILQICQLELPVIITKFMWWFEFSRYFYWNVGNRLTFICSPPTDKYKFHSRVPTLK